MFKNKVPLKELKKQYIKDMKADKLNKLQDEEMDNQFNEIIDKLNEQPESFFCEIESISNSIKNFKNKYKISILENFLSALKSQDKKAEDLSIPSENIYETKFEIFLNFFKDFLNEKNKNNDSFIFILLNNRKYDLILKLLKFCKNNGCKLNLNIEEAEEGESKNFIDCLLALFYSLNSMIEKNKNNIKNINIFNSNNHEIINNTIIKEETNKIKIQLLEEQIEKEKNVSNKIYQILEFFLDNFEEIVLIDLNILHQTSNNKANQKLYYFLKVENKINHFEELVHKLIIKKNKIEKEFQDIIVFFKENINEKNFDHFKADFHLAIRNLIYNGYFHETFSFLELMKNSISNTAIFKLIFNIKITDFNIMMNFHPNELPAIDLNLINSKAFECCENENLFDILFLNTNNKNQAKSKLNKLIEDNEGKKEILDFIFTMVNSEPVFLKIFCEIYSNEFIKKIFFHTLAQSKCFTPKNKLKILESMNKLFEESKRKSNNKMMEEDISINFFQASFKHVRYFIKEIDLDNDNGREFFEGLLSLLDLKQIKNFVEEKIRDKYTNNVDDLYDRFFPIDEQACPENHKNIAKIYNSLKPEIVYWISLQTKEEKLENLLLILIKNELLDFDIYFYKKGLIKINYQEKKYNYFKAINYLKSINTVCKKCDIRLSTNLGIQIYKLLYKSLSLSIENVYQVEISQYDFIYRNLLVTDIIEFFHSQILKNLSFIKGQFNDENIQIYISTAISITEAVISTTSKVLANTHSWGINLPEKLKFYNNSSEKEKVSVFEKNSLKSSMIYFNNFTKLLVNSLKDLIKDPNSDIDNIYHFYDKEKFIFDSYNRTVISNSFKKNTEDKKRYILNLINELKTFDEKTIFKTISIEDQKQYNIIQNINNFKIINSFNFEKNNSEFYLFNLLVLFETINLNSSGDMKKNDTLKINIKNHFKTFFFTFMRKENIFKSLSYLINLIDEQTFPSSQETIFEYIEDIIKSYFSRSNFIPEANYDGFFLNSSPKFYFFQFIYFIFRDFILTDFNLKPRNYAIRYRILNIFIDFFKNLRDGEPFEIFNIATYLIFKFNFINQNIMKELHIDSKIYGKKEISEFTSNNFFKNLPSKNYSSIFNKSFIMNDRYKSNKIQYIKYNFKNFSADHSFKKSIKVKSLSLYMLYKISITKTKSRILNIQNYISSFSNQIINSSSLLNTDFNNIFFSLKCFKEFSSIKSRTTAINVENMISALIKTNSLINDLDFISVKKDSDNESNDISYIEDCLLWKELYELLFIIFSEILCYIDPVFFRDYFKIIFYKIQIFKNNFNVNDSIPAQLKFLEHQLRQLSHNIVPNYLQLRKALKSKIETLSENPKFNDYFEMQTLKEKKNIKNLEREELIMSKQEENKGIEIPHYGKFTKDKFILDVLNCELEMNFLSNGISPENISLPNSLSVRVSEENRNINSIIQLFNKNVIFNNTIFTPKLNMVFKDKSEPNFKAVVNDMNKKEMPFSANNHYEFSHFLIDSTLKILKISDAEENVFLNKEFNEAIGNNIVLNIVKDIFDFTDRFSSQKSLLKNKILAKSTLLSFLDISKDIRLNFENSIITLNLPYNPFSQILQNNCGNLSLLKSYVEVIIKLDKLSPNFSYEEKQKDLITLLYNFYPLNIVYELYSETKEVQGINLLINNSVLLGVEKNEKFTQSKFYNFSQFEKSISCICECFKYHKNNNKININRQGAIYESFLYFIESSLSNNKTLENSNIEISYNQNENNENITQMYSKNSKTHTDKNMANQTKKSHRNIKESIISYSRMLYNIIDTLNIYENQHELTFKILGLIIDKVFKLINIETKYKYLFEDSNTGSLNSEKISHVEETFKKLIEKTFDQIIELDNLNLINKTKKILFIKTFWNKLSEINSKILGSNEKYCLIFYNSLRKLLIQEDQGALNLRNFKNEFLNSSNKYVLLAFCIGFNDIQIFEKLVSNSNSYILYEIVDFGISLITDYLFKNKKYNRFSEMLFYCNRYKLNAFHLILFNHKNTKDFFPNISSNIKLINFNSVFNDSYSIMEKLEIPNPLKNIFKKNVICNNEILYNQILECQIGPDIIENEVENSYDWIFNTYDKTEIENEHDNSGISSEQEKEGEEEKSLNNFENFNDEERILKKVSLNVTNCEENLLISMKETNTKIYFNLHKFIITIVKLNDLILLEDLKIHGISAADIILQNLNFYIKIFSKYIKSYKTLVRIFSYLSSSGSKKAHIQIDYFGIFFEYLKANNTTILNEMIEENSIFKKNLNFDFIFSEKELEKMSNIQEDSIESKNNFCQNKKLNLLIYYCVYFNLKDVLFFILEKITGKNIIEELIDSQSVISLKFKNKYEILLTPKFIEIALNKEFFELFVVLIRLIKFNEHWQFDQNIMRRKIDLLIEELFYRKNRNFYKYIKSINKIFLHRLTYISKLKIYLERKTNEIYRETSNPELIKNKDPSNTNSFEVQNCINDFLNNSKLVKSILFSNSEANEYLNLKDFYNLIKSTNAKSLIFTLILLLLIFKIKPLNLNYFEDFIYNFRNYCKQENQLNILILFAFIEQILDEKKNSFMKFKNSEYSNFNKIFKIILEIQNESFTYIFNKKHSLFNYENMPSVLNKDQNSNLIFNEDLKFLKEIENDYEIYILQTSGMNKQSIDLSEIQDKCIIDYAKAFYDIIKKNMFNYNIHELIQKEKKFVDLIFYEFLDNTKDNCIDNHIFQMFYEYFDGYDLNFKESSEDDINIIINRLMIIFQELFKFENLFLRQIYKYRNNKTHDSDFLQSINIIQYFDFTIDHESYYSLCGNRNSIEFEDQALDLLKNLIGINYCVFNKNPNLLYDVMETAKHKKPPREYSIKKYLEILKNKALGNNLQEDNQLEPLHESYIQTCCDLNLQQNFELLMYMLIFDPDQYIEITNFYFSDLQKIQKRKYESGDIGGVFDDFRNWNYLTLIDVLKEQYRFYQIFSNKLKEILFDNKHENNLLRKILYRISDENIKSNESNYSEKIFDNLNNLYESNSQKIVKMLIENINKLNELEFPYKENFVQDFDILEKVFNKNRKDARKYIEDNINKKIFSQTESNDKHSPIEKSVFDFFMNLIIDFEIIQKILDYYIGISNSYIYLQIKDKDIKEVFKPNNRGYNINYSICESKFLKEVWKNFYQNFLRIKFVLMENDSNTSNTNSQIQNLELKTQLKSIHTNNIKSLSQLIFEPILYILDNFVDKSPEIIIEDFKNELKNFVRNSSLNHNLKKSINKLENDFNLIESKELSNDQDHKEKTKFVKKNYYYYHLAKIINKIFANNDFYIIPIDAEYNFSIKSIADNIIQLSFQRDYEEKGKSINQKDKNDIVANQNKIKTSECTYLKNSLNIDEMLYVSFLENGKRISLDEFINDYLDKIIILFNAIIFGNIDIKSHRNSFSNQNQTNSEYLLNPAFYMLADYYKGLSNDFNNFYKEKSTFLIKNKINKQNIESIIEIISSHEVNKKSNCFLKTYLENEHKFLKKLLNINIQEGFIKMETWVYESICPIIHQNNKTLITSLIKNYVLIDNLVGKLTDNHAEDVIKLVSCFYNKGIESYTSFLKIIPQFYQFMEKFIINSENFAISNTEDIFSAVLFNDKFEIENNLEKYINPYKSDESFFKFISQIKLLIEVFMIDDDTNFPEKNKKKKHVNLDIESKFPKSLILENIEKVYLGVDLLIDILEKNGVDLDNTNHKLLGIKKLFYIYMNYPRQYLYEENLSENEKTLIVNSIDVDFEFEINELSKSRNEENTNDKKLEKIHLGVSKVILRVEKANDGNIRKLVLN